MTDNENVLRESLVDISIRNAFRIRRDGVNLEAALLRADPAQLEAVERAVRKTVAEHQGEISGLQAKVLTTLGINVQRALDPGEEG